MREAPGCCPKLLPVARCCPQPHRAAKREDQENTSDIFGLDYPNPGSVHTAMARGWVAKDRVGLSITLQGSGDPPLVIG